MTETFFILLAAASIVSGGLGYLQGYRDGLVDAEKDTEAFVDFGDEP